MVEQKILCWKNRINQTMNENNNVGAWTWRGSRWGGVDSNKEFEVWRSMGSDRKCWIWRRVSCGELGWWIEDSPVTRKVVEQEILYWKNRDNQMMNTNNNVALMVGQQITDFRFQISDFWFLISDFRFQNRLQISEFRVQIKDYTLHISDFRFLISDFRFSLISNPKSQIYNL